MSQQKIYTKRKIAYTLLMLKYRIHTKSKHVKYMGLAVVSPFFNLKSTCNLVCVC